MMQNEENPQRVRQRRSARYEHVAANEQAADKIVLPQAEKESRAPIGDVVPLHPAQAPHGASGNQPIQAPNGRFAAPGRFVPMNGGAYQGPNGVNGQPGWQGQPAPSNWQMQSMYPPQPGSYPPPSGSRGPNNAARNYNGGYQPPPQMPMNGGGYRPPVPPVTPRGKSGGRGQGGGKGGKLVLWLVIALVLVVLIVSAVIGGRALKEQSDLNAAVNAYASLYCEGVYVDGIHLGGMTQAEAQQSVLDQAQRRNDSWSVRLTYRGNVITEINAGQLGMSVDVIEPLRAAWDQGHIGTPEERKAAMDQLKETPYRAYTALPSGDTSVIDSILNALRDQVYTLPQDAYIATFNPGNTNPFTIVDEVPGYTLDIMPIKERIYQMLSTMESGSIEIVPVEILPNVTAADLRKTVTLRGTAYTEISTTSTEGRNDNIRRAFELVTGTILEPGKTFSFNNTVGERSTANGFFEAPEIVYNEMTTGIGGGVCQASTTLFQAAVKAGLKITDHTPHSEKANYTDYGMDATVYWYSNHRIDLKFQNNTEGNIYIVCSVQSNPNNRKRLIAKVDIYGMDLENVKYDFVSELVEELPYQSETRRDKNKNYVTYTDETFTKQTGRDGYVYQSYRVTLVNGKETERVPLFKDTYKPRDEIIYVGTTNRPAD